MTVSFTAMPTFAMAAFAMTAFAGTFAAPTGAQIPEGYDLQIDGILDVESTVAVESMSWGSVKNLYNPGR